MDVTASGHVRRACLDPGDLSEPPIPDRRSEAGIWGVDGMVRTRGAGSGARR